MERRRSLKVAVIGAGTAGLAAARELLRESHRVTVFEKGLRIGGTWAYDPRVESDPMGLDPAREVVHSSLYRSLRVNLPRELMSFTDYPFSKPAQNGGDARSFPGHEEVLRFLGRFAEDFGLVELVRFGHEVVRVERTGGGWAVEWRSRGGDFGSEVFEAVVVCNGKYTEPRVAQFPGMNVWPGLQIHSHNYRVPDPFKDKIVVVIGSGASGFDINREVSTVAAEVHQVTRNVHPIFEKMLGNGGITGRMHPMIKCAHEDGKLDFEDGSSIYADAIIHCTGYKYHLPFLKTNGVVEMEDTRVGPLYEHVFPPRLAPWLSFVGIPTMGGVIVMELQSKWIARVLSGKIALPSEEEMENSVQEFYRHLEETGCPKHHTHRLQNPFEYAKLILDKLGLPPLEGWIEEMLITMVTKVLKLHGGEFRDAWDVDEWLQEVRA